MANLRAQTISISVFSDLISVTFRNQIYTFVSLEACENIAKGPKALAHIIDYALKVDYGEPIICCKCPFGCVMLELMNLQ